MKWFKHDANAAIDSKLQRIKLKYGMEGYGLYWYLLECIARTVESHNLTFELEEDAELISAATGIHHERCEEMMRYMVSIKLFELSQGRIFCLKMADRTDEYTQKLIRNAQQLPTLPEAPDSVPTKSRQGPDKVPPNRIEENRTEQKRLLKTLSEVFDNLWDQYPNKTGKKEALRHYNATVKTLKDSDDIMMALSKYRHHLQHPHNGYKQYQNGSTWFNNWRDWVDWVEPAPRVETKPVKTDPMMDRVRKLAGGGKDGVAKETDRSRTIGIADGTHPLLSD